MIVVRCGKCKSKNYNIEPLTGFAIFLCADCGSILDAKSKSIDFEFLDGSEYEIMRINKS